MASIGTYGTRIPVNVSADDVEIYYSYRPTLNDDDSSSLKFTKLSSNILVQSYTDSDTGKTDNILEGMYNLKLPVEYFNKKGFYTVYIKPKEIELTIKDVSVLSTYSDVRGIVLDANDISDANVQSLLLSNNSLCGYRIIYYENGRRQDYYRLVTSNNRCEPVMQNIDGSSQKLVRYRYNNSSTLTFLTITPSSAPTFNANVIPFIGSVAQKIALVNTKFEPIMLEIEMVEHDADTISTMLEGSQLRDLDNGLVTTFNSDNEIYAQHEHYSLKDSYTGDPIYEIKKQKNDNIDFGQTIDDK